MEIFQAIILGIIEGFTEFLPISSTGHVIVGADVIGYKDTAEIFTVVVQMGAIAAIIWYYREDLINKAFGLFKWKNKAVKFWANIVVATLPVAFFGFLLRDVFDLVAVATTVGITLILGGIAIWLIETFHVPPRPPKKGDRIDDIPTKQALMVGIYQIIALIPGVSRAGATIMGGLLSGMDRVTAAAFSFYLSIPVILLAGGYQLISRWDEIDRVTGGGAALIAGTITSFFVALIVVKWLLNFVAKYDYKIFAYYRIVAGIVVLLVVVFN